MAKAKPKKNNSKLIEVLGPVENLESYVKADWWRNLFNANYLRTDGDVVEDQDITRNEVDLFIDALGLSPDSVILDLCCGQGRHALELSRRGFKNVFGLDRSHYLINRARKLNRLNGKLATFKEGDARKTPFATDTFDAVFIAGNSYGYFESTKDDVDVLKEVRRILKPQGKLLIDITDGGKMREKFEPRSWEWIDKNYFVCRERSLSQDQRRLVSREVITHTTKGVIADQFYAERLYTEDEIKKLISTAGFGDIVRQGSISSESKRNQDLGMMAQRIIVTAKVAKEWANVKKPVTVKRQVLVLMGDPTKTDIVKPNGSFDDDDFHTINALKKALASLPDYHFAFCNEHDTLLSKLTKAKEKYDYVFNLCDEGFNNDATKELHVAALLEMLDIPYSGGTPQCLAQCFDKSLVRGIAKEMDIPVPGAYMIKPTDISFIELPLTFPVIVKPNAGDSSFGITQNSVCYDLRALENALLQVRDRFGYNKPVLVEEFLEGKDISLGIIGNPSLSYKVLPIIEEDYSALPEGLPKICGYEAKWDPTSPYWNLKSIRADISEEVADFLSASCLSLFDRLECRDYARFDWRMDSNGTPRLLEVNPNPGWCWDGHMAKMAKLKNKTYADMLAAILKACEERVFGPALSQQSDPDHHEAESPKASVEKPTPHIGKNHSHVTETI